MIGRGVPRLIADRASPPCRRKPRSPGGFGRRAEPGSTGPRVEGRSVSPGAPRPPAEACGRRGRRRRSPASLAVRGPCEKSPPVASRASRSGEARRGLSPPSPTARHSSGSSGQKDGGQLLDAGFSVLQPVGEDAERESLDLLQGLGLCRLHDHAAGKFRDLGDPLSGAGALGFDRQRHDVGSLPRRPKDRRAAAPSI